MKISKWSRKAKNFFSSNKHQGTSIQVSGGVSVANTNGHLVIKGKFKSIKINGKIIK